MSATLCLQSGPFNFAGKPLYGALSLTRVTSSPPLPLQVRSYGKVQANGAGCSWNKVPLSPGFFYTIIASLFACFDYVVQTAGACSG